MFYFVEQIKGTPKTVEGLLFGSDEIYDYYVVGCKTTEEKCSGYYSGRIIKDWNDSIRKNTPSSFIKQYGKITKREGFTNTDNLMRFA